MDTTNNSRLQHNFFLVIFIGALILMLFVFKPFITSLILAFTLSVIFRPIYDRLTKRLSGRESVSAFITVCLVTLVVLLPLIAVGSLLFEEVRILYINLASNGGGTGILAHGVENIQEYLRQIAPGITINVASYLQYGLQWLVTHLDSFFSTFIHAFLVLLVMLIALFYILRDGERFKNKFILLSPLSDSYDESILGKLTIAISSVVKGSLIIAVVQGTLAAVGTTLAGLPNPAIWGILAMVASLIPGLGTGLIIGPAIIYLFVIRDIPHAVVLLIWQVLVVGLVDNFMTPYLLQKGMRIHPFLILLSVLGGIILFGPIGFILGPIILAFFFALLDIYPVIIAKR